MIEVNKMRTIIKKTPFSYTPLFITRDSSYIYKPLLGPLNSIRLILLKPSLCKTSTIRCSLIESRWSSEPPKRDTEKFLALSYTWGEVQNQRAIEVDGKSLHVTRNLESALRHLRHQTEVVRLWADGLCINQSDVEERNRHVTHMRSIYSAACNTIVFLGESGERSRNIFHAMRDSKHKGLADMTKETLTLAKLAQYWGISQDEIRNSVSEVLWRPYWSRVWIYQEIIVSNRIWIQCGTIKVSWDDFYYAMVVALSTSTGYFGAGYDNVIKNRLEDFYWERLAYRKSLGNDEKSSLPLWGSSHIPEDGRRLNLLDLLVTKRGYMASDSRDMIYALSGIAKKPKGTQPFTISYEKSPRQVYSDVVNYIIETDKNYNVLSHAEQHFNHASHIRPFVPSWVPDWTIRAKYKQKIVDWVEPLDKSTSAISNSAYLEDQGVLACVGYEIGIINLITDYPRDIQRSGEGRVGRILWKEWKDKKFPDSVLELFNRLHPLIYNRRYAETLEGICCMVPEGTQTGDVVCQFIGSSLPYILRPIPSTKIKSEKGWRAWKTLLHLPRWWNNSTVPTQELPTKSLDAKISAILQNKTSGYRTLEIRHCNFVGECFVDGLMNNEDSQTHQRQHSREKTAFAMH